MGKSQSLLNTTTISKHKEHKNHLYNKDETKILEPTYFLLTPKKYYTNAEENQQPTTTYSSHLEFFFLQNYE